MVCWNIELGDDFFPSSSTTAEWCHVVGYHFHSLYPVGTDEIGRFGNINACIEATMVASCAGDHKFTRSLDENVVFDVVLVQPFPRKEICFVLQYIMAGTSFGSEFTLDEIPHDLHILTPNTDPNLIQLYITCQPSKCPAKLNACH